ncbi:hypothetical protein RRG08_065945 [Elysia crispata]|uniref:Uncharacterized protein n=1 Tax=Elysia crispata TaxID=231223 RepID=A0AAE0ZGS8_9GAST|nr:hypothetical protein RRG08_065945 [Elysia crispata]
MAFASLDLSPVEYCGKRFPRRCRKRSCRRRPWKLGLNQRNSSREGWSVSWFTHSTRFSFICQLDCSPE